MSNGYLPRKEVIITEEQLKKVGLDVRDAVNSLQTAYRHAESDRTGDSPSDVFTGRIRSQFHKAHKWGDLSPIDPALVTEQEAVSHDLEEVQAMNERRAQAILDKIEILQDAFKEATGLHLDCDYHDTDARGSAWDDVDGPFYTVQGFYEPSEEALELQEKTGELEEAGFVEYA